MTIREAQMELREYGMTLSKSPHGGQYRVNFKGGAEATAYYTDDRDDAVLTGISMSRSRKAVVNPQNAPAALDGIVLATDEQHLLCSLINNDGTAGPHAEPDNLKFFTRDYTFKLARKVNAKKMTPLGRSVLKTLRKKLAAR